jgi:hypothetical protein
MRAVARIERTGVPLDGDRLRLLRSRWPAITQELVQRIDGDFGVYEGTTFKVALFERWLSANRLDWPRLETGHLDLKDETFKLLALTYPRLQPLRELRKTLAKMRLEDLAVGPDDRNRPQLSPFGGRTSRFSTSPSKSVFGAASWLRGLVRPPEGSALAYVDYEQQEFGIAASLSNDGTMMAAYESGDAYLAFAKQAALVPADATKDSHSAVRELCKKLLLALQYGMGTGTLAAHLGRSPAHARELLTLHRATYPRFWAWSDAAVQHANLFCSLHTVFGWTIHGPQSIPALRNFPMQANAAEMLRLACAYALDAGVAVCMPVHDALLIEAPISDIEDKVRATQSAMAAASADVLDGFVLRTDAKVFEYPNRFSDPRGADMWRTVSELLGVAP